MFCFFVVVYIFGISVNESVPFFVFAVLGFPLQLTTQLFLRSTWVPIYCLSSLSPTFAAETTRCASGSGILLFRFFVVVGLRATEIIQPSMLPWKRSLHIHRNRAPFPSAAPWDFGLRKWPVLHFSFTSASRSSRKI